MKKYDDLCTTITKLANFDNFFCIQIYSAPWKHMLGIYYCEAQRSHFVVISVKIKERVKIPHTMVFVHFFQK